MPSKETVVWSEGMFMRPQHLQQHTRYVEGLVDGTVNAAVSFGWGFSDLRLDRSMLATGALGLTSARGVFRDATPFELGDNAALPAPCDLTAAEPGAVVYLCAASRGGGARAQEFTVQKDEADAARYLAHPLDVLDNAAALADGDDDSQLRHRPGATEVVVGQLQMQLLLSGGDDHNTMRLPIARVADVLADGSVRLDEEFIAPVTRLSASRVLCHHVRELGAVVSGRADQLARRVGDLVSGVEFSLNILWLMVANRYDPVLRSLISTDLHPAALYRLLLGMAGELSTLNTPDKRPAEFPPYNHSDLATNFVPLMDELRTIWSAQPMEMVKELPMAFVEARQTWLSKIRDHNLLDTADFVLAAIASVSEDDLATRLPAQMIIAPAEQIEDKASDLRLSLAKVKPRNVPTLNRWTYFHLEPGGKAWDGLATSAGFAFFVDRLAQDFPDLQLKFWAVPRR